MPSAKNIAPKPNAATPAKRPARDVGWQNPRTKDTFADPKTSSAFSCGGRTTRATGAGSVKPPKMRYKIP